MENVWKYGLWSHRFNKRPYTQPLFLNEYPYRSGPPLAEVRPELLEIPKTTISVPIRGDDLYIRFYFPPQIRVSVLKDNLAPYVSWTWHIRDAVWTGEVHIVPTVRKDIQPPSILESLGWESDGKFKSFKYIAGNKDSKWNIVPKETFIVLDTIDNTYRGVVKPDQAVIGYPLLCLRLEVSVMERLMNPYKYYESFSEYNIYKNAPIGIVEETQKLGICSLVNAYTLRNGFAVYPVYQIVREVRNWRGLRSWDMSPAYL
jgi:hypothetical protein